MNLDQIKLTEIKKKKDYLFLAESIHPHLKKLLRQREELEKNIQEIQHQISTGFYHSSWQDPNPLDSDLKTLKQEIKKIDLILDEWDEPDEGRLVLMRENLFEEIWEQFSEQFEEQKATWNELKFLAFFEKKINPLQDFLDELTQILQGIRETRINMKGKGALSYIFGTSPNAIIEKYLLFAHELILKNLEPLKQISRHNLKHSEVNIFKKIYQTGNELKDECKKIWGFRHIDITIASHERALLNLSAQLKNLSKEIKEKGDDLRKDLDEWLNQILNPQEENKLAIEAIEKLSEL